jgi:hypothetical protein
MAVANASEAAPGPFGGWFGTIGGFLGFWAGWEMTESLIGVLIVGVVGGYVGLAVEHIVYKLLCFAVCIMIILARNEVLRAMFGG